MEIPATETITFLFTDLEGSTRLWEQFPDAMQPALRRHDTILREAIETSGGTVVKTTGDGMMAVFGRGVDAATASLGAQRELITESWGETGPLRVRMGIHCGEAEQRGGDYFGTTVNRAARIMAAGHGGQVLLSSSAASLATELLPAGTGLMDLGEHHLRDLGRPEHLYQLVHPDLPAAFPPLVTARQPGADLPSRVAALIGRRDEIAQITERLADGSVRLLTLIGPGGTGKTTLAIRVASDLAPRFRDGVSFVELASAHDTNAVLVAIARSVGLGEIIDRPLQDELVDRLRDTRMLIVLDNLEQVTESGAAVAQLLSDCAGLTVLATSREALHVRAEQVFVVPPLALPPDGRGSVTAASVRQVEAVQLFVDRARVARPDFELTDDNAAAVAEICRRLDGLPLAIELAAARLRLFSPEVLRDRLDDSLGLLRGGPRDLPERQQTLRAAMDWSYELLAPGEQRLFEQLAVFADAEVGAIEAVTDEVGAVDGEAIDVLDGLAGLVEKSLLRRIDAPGAEPRVAMLKTIREFATDRLERRHDVDARTRLAHASYYSDVARRLRAELNGARREAALEALHADIGNLRIAWTYWVEARDLEHLDGLAKALLALDDAHGWYLDTAKLAADMLAVVEAVPASPERINQEIGLRTTLARALMTTKGFTPEVEAAFAGALERFEQGADVGQQFAVLRGLASLYLFRAQLDKSAAIGQEILLLGEAENDPVMRIDGHLLVGTMLMSYDDLTGGLDHLEQAIALFPDPPTPNRTVRVGNDPRVSTLTTSAFTLWMLGRSDRAAERADAALELAAALDHPFTTAYARYHAGLLRLWRREPERAHDLAMSLLALADEHEFHVWKATGNVLLGASLVELGRADDGMAAVRAGIGMYGELRSPPIFWPFLLFVQARACASAGRPEEGLRAIDQALDILGQGEGGSIMPEIRILKGDLVQALATDGPTGANDAEPWYRLALDRATELGGLTAKLRAATRLARLRIEAGDPAGAAALLGPVHAAFTEGHDTADVLEATDLLANLSPQD
ncbi:MAG TPA: adenylate/guanylate cyclase domain-containing protein [Candidatus Limnocylindrales bacterium]